MTQLTTVEACTHACSFACGRKYDVVFTQVVDSSTLFLCMPCLVNLVKNIAQAMVEPDAPEIQEVVSGVTLEDTVLVTDNSPGYGVVGHSDPMPEDEFEFDGTD